MTDYKIDFCYRSGGFVMSKGEFGIVEMAGVVDTINELEKRFDYNYIDVLQVEIVSDYHTYTVFVEYVEEGVKTNEYKFVNADLSEDQYYDFIASLRELCQKGAVIQYVRGLPKFQFLC